MEDPIFCQTERGSKNQAPILEELPQYLSCQQCQQVSILAERIIGDANLTAGVEMLTSWICLAVPPKFVVECLQMADNLAHRAIQSLQVLFLDTNSCSSLGLCPDGNAESNSNLSFPWETNSSMVQQASASCSSSEGADCSPLDNILAQLQEARVCMGCRVVLGKIRISMNSPMVQSVIMKTLLRACMFTKRRYIRRCKRMVAQYGPATVTLLRTFVNVVDLCNLTHFCQSA